MPVEMNAELFLTRTVLVVLNDLSQMLTRDMATDEAIVLLFAIMYQESNLTDRRQVDDAGNPIGNLARGFAQFEAGGGVAGVMNHAASQGTAQLVCTEQCIPWNQADIHEAIAWHDYLAVAFARLLLYTDPQALPRMLDIQGSWDYYERNWRPGKPRPEEWPKNYARAMKVLVEHAGTRFIASRRQVNKVSS